MTSAFKFVGWKGWADFFSLMRAKNNSQTLQELRLEVLPLHRSIQKLVR